MEDKTLELYNECCPPYLDRDPYNDDDADVLHNEWIAALKKFAKKHNYIFHSTFTSGDCHLPHAQFIDDPNIFYWTDNDYAYDPALPEKDGVRIIRDIPLLEPIYIDTPKNREICETELGKHPECLYINNGFPFENRNERDKLAYLQNSEFCLFCDVSSLNGEESFLASPHNGRELLMSLCPEGKDCQISILNKDKPVPWLDISITTNDESHEFCVIPQVLLEEALESDMKEYIERDALWDYEIRDRIYESDIPIFKGDEARAALKAEMLDSTNFGNTKFIDSFAENISKLDFLKYRHDVEIISKNTTPQLISTSMDIATDIAHNAINPTGDMDKAEQEYYHLPIHHKDDRLINGIKQTLLKGNYTEISAMCNNLFGRNRVNEVHRLQNLGEKNLTR